MPSFDTVLEPNMVEVRNAVDQAAKEIGTRFDFKGTSPRVELKDKEITLFADSDFQLGQVHDILLAKLTKRNVDVRFLDAGRRSRRSAATRSSRSSSSRAASRPSTAKKIQTLDQGEQAQGAGAIQGDAVRVTGAKRDDLQAAMALMRKEIADAAALLQQLPRLSRCALASPPLLAAARALPAGAGADASRWAAASGNKRRCSSSTASRARVAVGATVDGVQLVSVTGNEAVVEVEGKRVALRLGDAPGQPRRQAERAAAARRSSSRPERRPLRHASGTINGQSRCGSWSTPARPTVAMGQSDADRIGLDYRNGRRGMTQHGQRRRSRSTRPRSPRCASATSRSTTSTRPSSPAPMPYILLGNSFLTRFQMKRENDTLTLDLR